MKARRPNKSKNIATLGCTIALLSTACSSGISIGSPTPSTLPFSDTTIPLETTLCSTGSIPGLEIRSSVLQSPTELTISENDGGIQTSFEAVVTIVEERADGIVYEWVSPENIASSLATEARASGLEAEFNALPERRIVYRVDPTGQFSLENRDEVLAGVLQSGEFIVQLLDSMGDSDGAAIARTTLDIYPGFDDATFTQTFAREALLWHSSDGLSITEGTSDEYEGEIAASFGSDLPATVSTQHLRDSENCEVFRIVSIAHEAELAESLGAGIVEIYGQDFDPDVATVFQEALEGVTYQSTSRVRFDEGAGVVRQVSWEAVLDIPGETETTTTLEIGNATPSA